MEHLHAANAHNKLSILGLIISWICGILAKIEINSLASTALIWVSLITGLATLGFTIDKWIQMRKAIKKGNKYNY